jgi:UDP-N-acetylglucosamine 2-epimerase (non-hydrolysing)
MERFEGVCLERRPDVVVVVGDVNSTLAAALVAAKLGIAVAHVEAGLRSFDRSMPEEINRVLTDALADYLFVTEASGTANLLREGQDPSKVHMVGNLMIETLIRFRAAAARSEVLSDLGLAPKGYAVVTLHRPSNVDNPLVFSRLLSCLQRIGRRLPVIFPIHPRARARLTALTPDVLAAWRDATGQVPGHGCYFVPPMGYLDFLRLTQDSLFVMTDSGGIQEETTFLQVPCLTLRDNTERPVTVEMGTNRLVGTDPEAIEREANRVLDGDAPRGRVPPLWDDRVSSRILDVLQKRRPQGT